MITIRLKIRHGEAGLVVSTYLVDLGHHGIDIRNETQSRAEAERSAVVELDDVVHCPACDAELEEDDVPQLWEALGLTTDERDKLQRWRDRKSAGVSGAELAAILDKVTAKFDDPVRKHTGSCSRDADSIVIEVEDVNA